MIRGGYYGDIRVESSSSSGHTFRYHMPDLVTGAPIAGGSTNNSTRLPPAYLHRTIAKALKTPDSVVTQFSELSAAAPLNWILR
jgi:hypothetical protein